MLKREETMRATAAQLYAAYRDNADSDTTLRLLRSRHAPAYLAIMAARLSDGHVRGDELEAAIETDLRDLSTHWTDAGIALPSAAELLDRWVKAGFLTRSLTDSGVGENPTERYQLTRAATSAIVQVQAVRHDRSVATGTVLEMIVARLSNIAVAINPDPGEHVRDIDQKIAELARSRDELMSSGIVPTVDKVSVFDDIRMVSSLVERMPADIIGYGEKLRTISRTLLAGDVNESGSAALLNEVFDGHDALAASSEGKAFDAFYTLLSDHRLRETLETHISQITSGLTDLPDDLAATLREFIDRMWVEVQSVDEVRGQVYRRINTFVKDSDFLSYRALRNQIADAQRAALMAFQTASAGTDMGILVPMAVAHSQSVGALSFHDGIIELPESVEITTGELSINPLELVGSESIDWQQLTNAVNASLEGAKGKYVGVEQIMAQLPDARTGDIIGIWSLAHRYGVVDDLAPPVKVQAHTVRGYREITLPAVGFTETLASPIAYSAPEPTNLLDLVEVENL